MVAAMRAGGPAALEHIRIYIHNTLHSVPHRTLPLRRPGSFYVVEDGGYDSSYYSAFYCLFGWLVGEIFADGVGSPGYGEGLEPDSSRLAPKTGALTWFSELLGV